MDKEIEMGKYDGETLAIAGRSDRDQQKALWSIANELAELNSFLRKDEAEKTEELLDALRRESGVDV